MWDVSSKLVCLVQGIIWELLGIFLFIRIVIEGVISAPKLSWVWWVQLQEVELSSTWIHLSNQLVFLFIYIFYKEPFLITISTYRSSRDAAMLVTGVVLFQVCFISFIQQFYFVMFYFSFFRPKSSLNDFV